ncbi:hypothetical protein [Ignatzschineria ureiclastica]
MFEKLYHHIGNLVESNMTKRQTASIYLQKLCGIG